MATVEYESRDRVGYLTLNRPDKLNAEEGLKAFAEIDPTTAPAQCKIGA